MSHGSIESARSSQSSKSRGMSNPTRKESAPISGVSPRNMKPRASKMIGSALHKGNKSKRNKEKIMDTIEAIIKKASQV